MISRRNPLENILETEKITVGNLTPFFFFLQDLSEFSSYRNQISFFLQNPSHGFPAESRPEYILRKLPRNRKHKRLYRFFKPGGGPGAVLGQFLCRTPSSFSQDPGQFFLQNPYQFPQKPSYGAPAIFFLQNPGQFFFYRTPASFFTEPRPDIYL